MQLGNDFYIWAVLGFVLLASEIFTGTFHLLFFGISGLVTACVSLLGVHSLSGQIAIFAVLSLLSALIIQKKIPRSHSVGFDSDKHQTLILSADLEAHGESMIQYQGSPWTAVNTSDRPLKKGEKILIQKTEGIKLFVKGV